MKSQILGIYKKYKIIIIPAGCGVICAVILLLVIIPQMMGYFETRDKITALISETEILNKKANDLENLDDLELKNNLELALTLLPIDKDVPASMADIQTIVASSSLILKNTNYTPNAKSPSTGGKESFALNLTLNGSISSFRNFINNLNNGSRIYKIDAISIRFPQDSQIIEAEIPLSVFYEKSVVSTVPLKEPIKPLTEADKELLNSLTNLAQKLSSAPNSTGSSVPLGKIDPFN